jgi:aldose 1-epimerase
MSVSSVILLSDGVLNVEIMPREGGRIAAFWSTVAGERMDWFVPGPDLANMASGSTAWGSFPLVPFSNRIREARFIWESREYRIAATEKNAPHAIHGHGLAVPWDLDDVSTTHAVMSYSYNGDDWPFSYRTTQVLELQEGSLRVTMELENTGAKPMPGGLGHHPYLQWREGPVLATSFGSIWPAIDGVLPAGPEAVPEIYDFSGPEGRKLSSGLDTGFGSWSGHALVSWPNAGLHLEIDASETLSHVILFTPVGAPFFCFEPVSHSIDAINLAAAGVAGTGIRSVPPKGRLLASMRFRPRVESR